MEYTQDVLMLIIVQELKFQMKNVQFQLQIILYAMFRKQIIDNYVVQQRALVNTIILNYY